MITHGNVGRKEGPHGGFKTGRVDLGLPWRNGKTRAVGGKIDYNKPVRVQ